MNLPEKDSGDKVSDKAKNKIMVCVRVRPYILGNQGKTLEVNPRVVGLHGNDTISLDNEVKKLHHRFSFDHIFGEDSTQKEVYDVAGRTIVESVLQTYNGTIFVYGQTGSGKTFTMEGVPYDRHLRGIMTNAFLHLFEAIEEAKSKDPDRKYLLRVSFLEIYKDHIYDLLSDPSCFEGGVRPKLKLKNKTGHGLHVEALTAVEVYSAEEVLEIFKLGRANRQTAATKMNHVSSRSHSILNVVVETAKPLADGSMDYTVAKLNMVDLAGSERNKKSGSEAERLVEAAKINKSLSALGNVITALAAGRKQIPYRDSVLTMLLKDSLGGSSKTMMIANVEPSLYNYDETMSTLRYALQVRDIKNNAIANQGAASMYIRLREEENEKKRLEWEREERARKDALKREKEEKEQLERQQRNAARLAERERVKREKEERKKQEEAKKVREVRERKRIEAEQRKQRAAQVRKEKEEQRKKDAQAKKLRAKEEKEQREREQRIKRAQITKMRTQRLERVRSSSIVSTLPKKRTDSTNSSSGSRFPTASSPKVSKEEQQEHGSKEVVQAAAILDQENTSGEEHSGDEHKSNQPLTQDDGCVTNESKEGEEDRSGVLLKYDDGEDETDTETDDEIDEDDDDHSNVQSTKNNNGGNYDQRHVSQKNDSEENAEVVVEHAAVPVAIESDEEFTVIVEQSKVSASAVSVSGTTVMSVERNVRDLSQNSLSRSKSQFGSYGGEAVVELGCADESNDETSSEEEENDNRSDAMNDSTSSADLCVVVSPTAAVPKVSRGSPKKSVPNASGGSSKSSLERKSGNELDEDDTEEDEEEDESVVAAVLEEKQQWRIEQAALSAARETAIGAPNSSSINDENKSARAAVAAADAAEDAEVDFSDQGSGSPTNLLDILEQRLRSPTAKRPPKSGSSVVTSASAPSVVSVANSPAASISSLSSATSLASASTSSSSVSSTSISAAATSSGQSNSVLSPLSPSLSSSRNHQPQEEAEPDSLLSILDAEASAKRSKQRQHLSTKGGTKEFSSPSDRKSRTSSNAPSGDPLDSVTAKPNSKKAEETHFFTHELKKLKARLLKLSLYRLRHGAYLYKHEQKKGKWRLKTKSVKCEFVFYYGSTNVGTLYWCKVGQRRQEVANSINIADIKCVHRGFEAGQFFRHRRKGKNDTMHMPEENCCFAVETVSGLVVQFEAASFDEREVWVDALVALTCNALRKGLVSQGIRIKRFVESELEAPIVQELLLFHDDVHLEGAEDTENAPIDEELGCLYWCDPDKERVRSRDRCIRVGSIAKVVFGTADPGFRRTMAQASYDPMTCCTILFRADSSTKTSNKSKKREPLSGFHLSASSPSELVPYMISLARLAGRPVNKPCTMLDFDADKQISRHLLPLVLQAFDTDSAWLKDIKTRCRQIDSSGAH